MLNAGLLLAALGLGLSAAPHCALMCGAPCAALTQGGARSGLGFHAGRLAGYAAAGALAASSMAALAAASAAAPALRPLWQLLHLGLLALGLWWLATGRQPAWGQRQAALAPLRFMPRARPPLRAGLAGLAWVALPCGVLQAALLLAAMADDALSGALLMAVFALASTPALALAPLAWARRPSGTAGLRLAGAALALMSGWALSQGVWRQLYAAWCAS